jgi:hypothetical protein
MRREQFETKVKFLFWIKVFRLQFIFIRIQIILFYSNCIYSWVSFLYYYNYKMS